MRLKFYSKMFMPNKTQMESYLTCWMLDGEGKCYKQYILSHNTDVELNSYWVSETFYHE